MARSTATVLIVIALLGGAAAFLAINNNEHVSSDPGAQESSGPALSPADDDSPATRSQVAGPRDADDTPVQEKLGEYERMREEFVSALGGHYLDKECVRETVYRTDPETGTTLELQQSNCTPTKPEHPYRSYSTEALESLAYSDPVAAAVLGQRMWANGENIHKTVDMMMRATALSDGQWVHLQWLTAQRFSGVSRNGVPDVQSIHARYVLETVMDNLRTDGGHREQWLRQIQDSYVIPESDIPQLEHTADLYMQRIRQIQRDVMGLTDMEVDEHAQSTQANP